MSEEEKTHKPFLRHKKTGEIYPYSKILAKRDDVEETDEAPPVTAAAPALRASLRAPPPQAGNSAVLESRLAALEVRVAALEAAAEHREAKLASPDKPAPRQRRARAEAPPAATSAPPPPVDVPQPASEPPAGIPQQQADALSALMARAKASQQAG